MVRSNIPAGFCDNCGNVIFVGKKFCGGCGRPVDANTRIISLGNTTTISDLNIAISTAPPANTVTPPLDSVKNPTGEQIRIARTSLSNPYAEWGTLVCDDSSQKMWEKAPIKKVNKYLFASGSYAGNTFCLMPAGGCGGLCISTCACPLTDFAFQTYVSLDSGYVGLVFRSDNTGDTSYRYVLKLDYGTGHLASLDCYLLGQCMAHLVNQRLEAKHFPNNTGKQLQPGFLLAVVAQGETIDLYVNLTHITRVHDFNISTGAIGIYASNVHSAIFTHARVWKKN